MATPVTSVEQNGAEQVSASLYPVYLPFKTFLTALDTLEQGLPNELDRSVWSSLAGSTQSHILSAFRFLRLIDGKNKVQTVLKEVVDAKGEARKFALRAVLLEPYKRVVNLAESKATWHQLEEAFREHGLSGGTLERACRFYLDAAAYVDLPVSPHWSKSNLRRHRNTDASRQRRKNTESSEEPDSNDDEVTDGSDGEAHTIELRSGGTVTLSLSIDLIRLAPDDRKWLLELVDRFNSYEPGTDSDVENDF